MHRLRFLTYFTVAFVFGGGVLLVFLQHLGLFEIASVPVDVVMDSVRAQAPTPTELRLKQRLEATVRDLRGKKIWDVDLSRVRASLSRDEWVKDVLISRSFPNELRVTVRSKAAGGILVSGQGQFLPITEEGAILGALPAGALPDVPILRGEIFAKDAARREAVMKFLGALPSQGPLTMSNVSEVAWSGEDGYVLTLIQPKTEVKLGEDRVDLKALRVAQVMNYLTANSLKGRVIDASYSKKVLVRLRKGP